MHEKIRQKDFTGDNGGNRDEPWILQKGAKDPKVEPLSVVSVTSCGKGSATGDRGSFLCLFVPLQPQRRLGDWSRAPSTGGNGMWPKMIGIDCRIRTQGRCWPRRGTKVHEKNAQKPHRR
jgi:hypothetical protein